MMASVAIGAFVTSKLVFITELGLGIALAVLIDAFVIRALLVSSLMALLGNPHTRPLHADRDTPIES
jgi:uncharacterized membrane protein YdfJ with MMPL/SSD domain